MKPVNKKIQNLIQISINLTAFFLRSRLFPLQHLMAWLSRTSKVNHLVLPPSGCTGAFKNVAARSQGLVGLVYWGLTPQKQPGSYQGGEMMMMKSVFWSQWWRKPEYPEETTDLRQVTDETFHTYSLCPVRGLNLGRSGGKEAGKIQSLTKLGRSPMVDHF